MEGLLLGIGWGIACVAGMCMIKEWMLSALLFTIISVALIIGDTKLIEERAIKKTTIDIVVNKHQPYILVEKSDGTKTWEKNTQ